MSTFSYHKPGIGNTSSYLVSGLPFITCSIAPPLDETSAVVNFPRVTNYVVVKNTSETNVGLRVSFNNDSIVDNTRYVLLSKGESFSGELRTTDVHLMSDGAAPVPFTVIAGLTNIERGEMTQTVPKPPNLLAWAEKQKLVASDPDGSPEGDLFGGAVTMTSDGRVMAIGAIVDEENDGANAGAVYIFESGSSGYQQIQKLTASFGTDGLPEVSPEGDRFGWSVTFSATGETLAVGAVADEENNGADAGAVYIFESGSSGYQQVQKLTASFGTDGLPEVSPQGDYFGYSVTLSATGETLAVGAVADEENNGADAGSVYIFASGSGGYQQTQKLTASFGTDGLPEVSPQGDNFGFSITLSSTGETLAVGAVRDEENNGADAGSVYIFASGSGGYQQVQKLTASFGTDGLPEVSPQGDWFGTSVAFSSTGETLAVGARLDEENNGASAGSVYIFESGSGGYQQVQKLTASFGTDGLPEVSPQGDRFGYAVALSATGETLAVAAYTDEENNGASAGAVYIFESGSGGYQQVQKLTASFGTDGLPEVSPQGDQFSYAVTLSATGETLAVGARVDEENNGANAGAVYVFRYTRDY